eukprot:TRINITY_DN289_c0_g1_i4.p1 TRINITY_DN289_c0_g1~~TRINITY_DN289_c0_g1_i4.p1  ORF type:complete len:4683 (+),score=945.47 TRINITY_DN289_c0_g1_i4:1543-14049(+)
MTFTAGSNPTLARNGPTGASSRWGLAASLTTKLSFGSGPTFCTALGTTLNSFGTAVAITPLFIFVGAPSYSVSGAAGAVFAFDTSSLAYARVTTGSAASGTCLAVPTFAPTGSFSQFGAAIATLDTLVCIGAPGPSTMGQVHCYKIQRAYNNGIDTIGASGMFSTSQILSATVASTQFGSSISLYASANRVFLAVGSPSANGGKGQVDLYSNSSSTFVSAQTLPSPFPSTSDKFGTSVLLYTGKDYPTLAVGAPGVIVFGQPQGGVAMYQLSTSTVSASLRGGLVPGDWAAGNFGTALAAVGTRLVIGAPDTDTKYAGDSITGGVFFANSQRIKWVRATTTSTLPGSVTAGALASFTVNLFDKYGSSMPAQSGAGIGFSTMITDGTDPSASVAFSEGLSFATGNMFATFNATRASTNARLSLIFGGRTVISQTLAVQPASISAAYSLVAGPTTTPSAGSGFMSALLPRDSFNNSITTSGAFVQLSLAFSSSGATQIGCVFPSASNICGNSNCGSYLNAACQTLIGSFCSTTPAWPACADWAPSSTSNLFTANFNIDTGRYETSFAVPRAGYYILSGLISSSPVSSTATVTVSSGTVSISTSYMEPPSGIGNLAPLGTYSTLSLTADTPVTLKLVGRDAQMNFVFFGGVNNINPSEFTFAIQPNDGSTAEQSYGYVQNGYIFVNLKCLRAGNGVFTANRFGTPVLEPYGNTLSWNTICIPGSPSPSMSYIVGPASVTASGNLQTQYSIQARDSAGNNATAPVSFSVTASSGSVSGITIGTSPNSFGRYTLSFYANQAGVYFLSLYLGGTFCVQQSVEILPGSLSPSNSYGTWFNAITAGNPFTVTVNAMDSYGNRLTSSSISMSANLSPINQSVALYPTLSASCAGPGQSFSTPTPGGPCQSLTCAYGCYEVVSYSGTMYPTLAGTYSLSVSMDGQALTNGLPSTITVSPGQTSASRSIIGGNWNGTVGTQGTFWVRSYDAYDNLNPTTADSYTATFTGPQTITASCGPRSGFAGTYDCYWTPTSTGTYSLAVKLVKSGGGEEPVKNSPVTSWVSSQTSASAAQSLVQSTNRPTPTAWITAGGNDTILIYARDTYGSAVTVSNLPFQLSWQLTSDINPTVISATYGGGNLYTAFFSVSTAGSYTMSVLLQGAPVAGSPYYFTVQPGPFSAAQSVVSLQSAGAFAAGSSMTALVSFRDAYSNNLPDLSTIPLGSLSAVFTGPNSPSVSFGTPSGAAPSNVGQASWTSTVSGSYTITLKFGSTPIGAAGSYPIPFTVAAGEPSTLTYCFGSGWNSTGQPVSAIKTFLCQFVDTYGNALTSSGNGAQMTGTLLNPAGIDIGPSVTPTVNPNGTLTLTYDGTVAGTYSIDIRLGNSSFSSPLSNSPSFPSYVAGPTSAAASTAVGDVTGEYSFGAGYTRTVVVQARDQYGNLRTTGGDSVTASATGIVTVGNGGVATSSGGGNYTITYTVTAVGATALQIKLGGVNIQGSPFTITGLSGPTLASVTPTSGPTISALDLTSAATLITLIGTNFPNNQLLRCSFPLTGTVTVATYRNATMVTCPTPRRTTSGTTSVVLDTGGPTATCTNCFSFYDQATVSSINPNKGPVFGGTVVTVSGTGYANTALLSCSFGSLIVAASFVSSTTLVCTAPSTTTATVVQLSVSLNRQQFSFTTVSYTYQQSVSDYCRSTGQLPFGLLDQAALNAEYFPNLLGRTSSVATSPLTGYGLVASDLVDGDRCCLFSQANLGYKCGVTFQQNNAGPVYAQVSLPSQSYVNMIVTSWNDPCRNEPTPSYTIEYFNGGNWSTALQRFTTGGGDLSPCAVIDGDGGRVSVCVDWIAASVTASQIRISFNNSVAAMGQVPSNTDGGWMYELEAHGIATNAPYRLQAQVAGGSSNFSVASAASVALPAITLTSQSLTGVTLGSLDTAAYSIRAVLVPVSLAATLTTAQLASYNTTQVNMTGATATASAGMINFTNLALTAPAAGSYALIFNSASPTVSVRAAIIALTVTAGSAVRVVVVVNTPTVTTSDSPLFVSTFNRVVQSTAFSTLPAVFFQTVDAGGNFAADSTPRTLLVAHPQFATSTIPACPGNCFVSGRTPLLQIQLAAPAVGVTTVNISSPGLVGAVLTVEVVAGPPAGFAAPYFNSSSASSTLSSAAPATLPAIRVPFRDAGGAIVPMVGNVIASVQIISGPSTSVLDLAAASIFVDSSGILLATNIQLNKAPAGVYLLQFFAVGGGFTPSNISITIVPGAAYSLSVAATNSTVTSAISTIIPAAAVTALDAGGNAAVSGAAIQFTVASATPACILSNAPSGTLPTGTTGTWNNGVLSRPPTGLCQLRFSAAGLLSGLLNITVLTGAPVSLSAVLSSAPLSSQISTPIPGFTVYAVDASGTQVGATDATVRTVSVTLLGPTSSLTGSRTLSMTAGSAFFGDLALGSPVAGGAYSLLISASPLTSTRANLTIVVGPSAGLRVLPASLLTPIVVTSSALTRIRDISIETIDAGGNNTLEQARSIFAAGSGGAVLSGSPVASSLFGVALFNSLDLVNPPAGVLTLVFSAPSLGNTTLTLTVLPGRPNSIAVSGLPASLASVATTALGTLQVSLLDPGNNLAALNATETVTATVAVQTGPSALLTGTTSVTTAAGSGTATFSDLALANPPLGTYTLSWTAVGTTSAGSTYTLSKLTQLEVTVGPAYCLGALGVSSYTVHSAASNPLPTFMVRVLDAGRNIIPVDTPRNITVEFVHITGIVIQNILTGPTVMLMPSGQIMFNGLVLHAPAAGSYYLRFSSPDLIPSQAGEAGLTVVAGQATALTASFAQAVTDPLPSAYTTNIPPVVISCLDAGGNPTTTISSVFLVNVSLLAGPAAVLQAHGPVSVDGTGTATLSDLVFLSPPAGVYTLRFAAQASLTETLINVTVGVGSVVGIAVEWTPNSFACDLNLILSPGVVVRAIDAGGNFNPTASFAVTPSLSPYPSSLTSRALVLQNGEAVFYDLAVSTPPAGSYNLSFAAVINSNDVLVSVPFSVDVGVAALLRLDTTELSLPSSASTVFPQITIGTFDICGDPVPSVQIAVQVSQTASSDVPTLAFGDSASLTRDMVAGVATFENISVLAPAIGAQPYLVRFSAGVTFPAIELALTIEPGAPTQLFASPAVLSSVYVSARSLLGQVTITALDAGGNLLEFSPSDALTVSAGFVGLPVAAFTSGLDTQVLTTELVWSQIEIGFVPNGTYILSFDSSGLQSALVSVTLLPGLPYALAIVSADSNGPFSAARATPVGSFSLAVTDAGGSILSNGAANVTVRAIASVTPSVDLELSGVVSLSTADGPLIFDSFFANNPPVGTYKLIFSAIQALQPAYFSFVIVPGAPTRITTDPSRNLTTNYLAGPQTSIGPFYFIVADAGFNPVVLSRRASTFCVSILFSPVSWSTQAGTSQTTTLSGTTTVCSNSSAVVFIDLVLNNPQAQVYTLNFQPQDPYSAFDASVILIQISASGSARLLIQRPPTGVCQVSPCVYTSTGSTPAVSVFVSDWVGNVVSVNGTVVSTAFSPNHGALTEGPAVTVNGFATWSTFSFSGRRGLTYNLTFFSPGLGSAITTVSVRTCAEEDPLSVVSPDDANKCVCGPGSYQDVTTSKCKACAVNFYKDLSSNGVCNPCPSHMITLQEGSTFRDCICDNDYYLTTSTNNTATCADCPAGAECYAGGTVTDIAPTNGNWRPSAFSAQTYQCPNPAACRGGVNSTCAVGYTGPLCGVCADGYGSLGNTCQPCQNSGANVFLLLLTILMVLLFVGFLGDKRVDRATAAGPRKRKGQSTILTKILVNFLQIFAFTGGFRLDWPVAVSNLFAGSEMMTFSISIVTVDCSIRLDYFQRFTFYVLLPIFALLVPIPILATYYAFRVYRVRMGGYGEMPTRNELVNRYWTLLIVTLTLAHPGVTKQALQFFNCVKVGDSNYLIADLSVSCDTDRYNRWVAGAIVFLVIYCFGGPILLFFKVYRNLDKMDDPFIWARYSYLIDGYKREKFYWELVIMLRKMFIVGVSVFLRYHPSNQVFAGLWLIVVSLVMHVHHRPFENDLPTRLEMLALSVLFYILMAGSLFSTDDINADFHRFLVVTIFILVISMILFFLLLIASQSDWRSIRNLVGLLTGIERLMKQDKNAHRVEELFNWGRTPEDHPPSVVELKTYPTDDQHQQA